MSHRTRTYEHSTKTRELYISLWGLLIFFSKKQLTLEDIMNKKSEQFENSAKRKSCSLIGAIPLLPFNRMTRANFQDGYSWC